MNEAGYRVYNLLLEELPEDIESIQVNGFDLKECLEGKNLLFCEMLSCFVP